MDGNDGIECRVFWLAKVVEGTGSGRSLATDTTWRLQGAGASHGNSAAAPKTTGATAHVDFRRVATRSGRQRRPAEEDAGGEGQ
jgi:hypothetical protein